MSDSSAVLIPILMCLCFTILFFGVVGGIFFFAHRSGQATNRAWGDLGMRTGLTVKQASIFSSPELNGEYRHRPIRVYTYSSGTPGQGNNTAYTAVALTVSNTANSALEITPSSSVGNFFGKMLNAQDIEIGSPAFDARFAIKSNPADFAVRLLADSPVQTGIMDIPGTFRIHLEGSSLVYSRRDTERNVEFLTKLFNTLSDLADRIEGNKDRSFTTSSSND